MKGKKEKRGGEERERKIKKEGLGQERERSVSEEETKCFQGGQERRRGARIG